MLAVCSVAPIKLEVSRCTSVNHILAVEVVNRAQNLLDRLGGILLCEFTLLANTVEQLASRRQLCYNVVLVLSLCELIARLTGDSQDRSYKLTLDSNQSTNLTIWGCFRR